MFSNDQICTIANLSPSLHLHFGTGLKMYCKSDFSSCELYYPWLPDCRAGQSRLWSELTPRFFGGKFLVPWKVINDLSN